MSTLLGNLSYFKIFTIFTITIVSVWCYMQFTYVPQPPDLAHMCSCQWHCWKCTGKTLRCLCWYFSRWQCPASGLKGHTQSHNVIKVIVTNNKKKHPFLLTCNDSFKLSIPLYMQNTGMFRWQPIEGAIYLVIQNVNYAVQLNSKTPGSAWQMMNGLMCMIRVTHLYTTGIIYYVGLAS